MKQLITLTAFLSFLLCFSQTNEVDSLTIQLAYQKQDSSKVKTSVQLIKALYQNKDFKKALLYIDQTENLSNQLGYTKGIADTHYYKALIYTQKDDYFNAIDSYNKAKSYYQELNDVLENTVAMKEEIAYELQQLKEAMESITGALADTDGISGRHYELSDE